MLYFMHATLERKMATLGSLLLVEASNFKAEIVRNFVQHNNRADKKKTSLKYHFPFIFVVNKVNIYFPQIAFTNTVKARFYYIIRLLVLCSTSIYGGYRGLSSPLASFDIPDGY